MNSCVCTTHQYPARRKNADINSRGTRRFHNQGPGNSNPCTSPHGVVPRRGPPRGSPGSPQVPPAPGRPPEPPKAPNSREKGGIRGQSREAPWGGPGGPLGPPRCLRFPGFPQTNGPPPYKAPTHPSPTQGGGEGKKMFDFNFGLSWALLGLPGPPGGWGDLGGPWGTHGNPGKKNNQKINQNVWIFGPRQPP